mmetsp:Transcript_8498/g.13032  ORF Transcript_8498/g.13032 Transcript_8498/m.13032 type:complete len:235 (-) Transcript_8498:256-960(-)
MTPHCRSISYRTTGAHAAILSEFFAPNIGISTTSSRIGIISVSTPVTSFPSTKTVPSSITDVSPESVFALPGYFSCVYNTLRSVVSIPMSFQDGPFSFRNTSMASRVVEKCRLGTCRSAPSADLLNFSAPLPKGCGDMPVVITSAHPHASAVRKRDPTLKADRTLSKSNMSGKDRLEAAASSVCRTHSASLLACRFMRNSTCRAAVKAFVFIFISEILSSFFRSASFRGYTNAR